jgi:hypothetical protein
MHAYVRVCVRLCPIYAFIYTCVCMEILFIMPTCKRIYRAFWLEDVYALFKGKQWRRLTET